MCWIMLYSTWLLRRHLYVLLNWQLISRVHNNRILSPKNSNSYWRRMRLIIVWTSRLKYGLRYPWDLSNQLMVWRMRPLFIWVKLLLLLYNHWRTDSSISWAHCWLRQNSLSNVASVRALWCCSMTSCLTHAVIIIDEHIIVRMIWELISGQYHLSCVNRILLNISVRSLQLTNVVVVWRLYHYFVRCKLSGCWINSRVKVKLRAFGTCIRPNMALTWVILDILRLLNDLFVILVFIIVFEFI